MRLVSLFSGCGGLDLGLVRAGFQIVFANDNDPFAAESHRRNFGDVPFFEGSISEVDETVLRSISQGEAQKDVALLAGGPPCPPYSKSRFYLKDKPRALADPNGLETINGYLRVLGLVTPRAFLLENVPGLAYGPHRVALNHILRSAESLGYSCQWQVLNAADYGVPQIRQRLFVIGTRAESPAFPPPTHRDPNTEDLLAHTLPSWTTAGDAIADLDTEENASDEGHVAGGKHRDLLVEVPPGENYLYFTQERGHPNPQFKWRSRYWSFLLKLSPDRPSWTIQAKRSNNMGPFHWRNRILRIEEIKRLQTFPDDWELAGRTDSQWRQVGNAVPPLLAQRIGESLMEHLGASVGWQETTAS